MNSLLGFFMLFFALSCSTVLWKERPDSARGISSMSFIEGKNKNQLSCFENHQQGASSVELLEYFLIDQQFQVGVGHSDIVFYQGDDCKKSSHRLDFHDSIAAIDDTAEKLVLRTMHGHLILVGDQGIEKRALSFPVASFEVVGQKLHLYDANGVGRFCDYYQLQLAPDKRDKACQVIAQKQNL